MKKLSILIAVLAVVLCLFTGCATTDGNVSGSDSGSIGSDMPDNAPTDRPNTDDGAMTDPDSDTAPDSQHPATAARTTPQPMARQAARMTVRPTQARRPESPGRWPGRHGQWPPGQLVRGTGTADMVTGDTPATDRGASRTAPGPQAA